MKNKVWILGVLMWVNPLWAAVQKEEVANVDLLRQSYHRFETAYGVSRVSSVKKSQKVTLQNFLFSGDMVLTPQVSLTGRVPFVSLAGQLALANPSIGLRGVLFEGLLKGFPSFVFFHVDMKPPISSRQEFVFKRTDIAVGISSIREVYHLSLQSGLEYILKLDSYSSKDNFGNELSAEVGAELDTGYQFSGGVLFNYRHAGDFQNPNKKTSGLSLLIFKPHFTYYYDADILLRGTFAAPIGRQRLNDALQVFGDYTIAGLGGNTLFLTFEKKF